MSYDLGAIITKVQNKLDDTGFSSTILTDFANDTQRELFNNKFMQFMETSANFSINAGDSSLGTLPTDLQLPINLRITSPTALYKVLDPMTAEDFDNTFGSANALLTTGTPFIWYPFGTADINFYPIASTAVTMNLRYYKVPTELVNSTDVPEIPVEFQEILVLGMYKRALEYNDSFDQSAYITVKMEKLVDDMSRRYSPKSSATSRIGINRKISGRN